MTTEVYSETINQIAERIPLLWINIDNVTFSQALDRIVSMSRDGGRHYVVTPNVDHIIKAKHDDEFRAVYDRADLILADGMPVLWASKWLGTPLKEKVSGSDLFPALCERAAQEKLRVFLLGGNPGVAEKARDNLLKKYPDLMIVGTHSPTVSSGGQCTDDGQTINLIRDARPDILFVALGCPKQEKFIARYKNILNVPVSLGVGAAFDFVAGTQKRSPRWMQRAGLEWMWRLMKEPRRLWKRYLVEDIVILVIVIRTRYKSIFQKTTQALIML